MNALVAKSIAVSEVFFSKSFYMNKDYLYTTALNAPIPLGKTTRANQPEIQKIIINEFQPYDVVSLGDLLGGVGNAIGGALARSRRIRRTEE